VTMPGRKITKKITITQYISNVFINEHKKHKIQTKFKHLYF